MSVYVTGDTHGNFKRIGKFCNEQQTTVDDILVILGDVGLNYNLNRQDDYLKSNVSELPITLLCIHGNHEERPYNVDGYKTKAFNHGIVWYQEKYPNILFAQDGSIFEFNNLKCLCIGGAYSVDKFYRLKSNLHWFSSEQPTEEEKAKIEKSIAAANWKVDFVFTHTCPYETRPSHLFLDKVDQSTVDTSMEEWLQTISDRLDFDEWFFGHYHKYWRNGKYRMLYEDIIMLIP
jgi:3-oxoacid CoA-transferase subunit A